MKKSLNACVLTLLILIGVTYNSAAQTKCLANDYPLNGNATDIVAAKNGTLYSTSSTVDRFGRSNFALQFNGSSSWVKLGTDADLKERTISLWLKADTFLSGGKYSQAFATDNANNKYGGTGISLDNSGGVNRISIGVGTNIIRYNGGVKGQWYHCVILVNTTHVKFYLNGKIVDSTLNNSTSHSTDGDIYAHLGCSRNSTLFFKGSLDDVKIYSCGLSKSQIDSLYAYTPIKTCLAADFKLDGSAKDNTGNGNDGTLKGTSSTINRFGKSGSALKFNGTSDLVKLGTDADFPSRTISLWLNADTFPTGGKYSQAFSTDNANFKYGGTGISLDNSGGANRISIGVGANVIRYSGAIKNKWYHCVITVNSTHVKYYLNGKIVDSTLNNSTSHSTDGDVYALLGCNRNSNANFFKGLLDDLSIYNCALLKAEIEALYNYSPCSAELTTEPKNQSVNISNTASFSVLSFDNNANYKWQLNTGSGFSDLTDGGQFSGSKTKNLLVTGVKYSTNNNQMFRCIASNSSCADTSLTATLRVLCSNLIKTEPSNVNAGNGSDVNFITASSFSSTTLTWQGNYGSGFINLINGSQYSGANKDTLNITGILLSNNGNKFRCIASYDGCLDTSAAALLSVYCNPILKSNPINTSINKGKNAKLSVGYFDNGTLFQWQLKNGTSFVNLTEAGQYNGTNADSLFISSVNLSNDKQEYRCILSFKGCKDTSKGAVLTVLCNPIVNTSSGNQTKTEGETALFTLSSLDNQASYEWQVNAGIGYQNLNNSTKIKGVTNDSLTISNLTLADNNQVFRCILSSGGCFDTTKSATLLVSCKTILNSQPKNVKAFVSNNAILSFSSFEANATFAWQSDVGFGYQNLSNAGQYNGVNNDSLIVSNVSLTNNNQKFRCILTLGNCTETTEIATLQVICNTIIDRQPVNKTAAISGSTFLNVSAFDSKATYRWQSDVGFGYQNLSNAGQYRGVNNDTLIINDLTASNNNQTFRCIINTGACGDTTDIASITVKSAGITPHEHGEISVFPNPSNGFIYLKINPNLLNNTYKVIDQQGRVIADGKLTESNTKISIEHLANGVYILQTEPTLTRTLIIKQ
jgi:hypothetical protein